MAFDYSKLRGRIIEKCGTLGVFAKKMGVSRRTLSLKLNNRVFWTQGDISKACEILDISGNDITAFFYDVCSK